MKLTALIWLLALAAPVFATIAEPLSLDELATRAQLVVRGKVLRKSCQRDESGRIYTKVELDVVEVWKGGIRPGPLTIVHGGGVLGEERHIISGQVEYRLGEEIVAFLLLNARREAVTLGLAHGKFQIYKDPQTGVEYARNQFHSGDGLRSEVKRPGNSASTIALTTLKSRVSGEKL